MEAPCPVQARMSVSDHMRLLSLALGLFPLAALAETPSAAPLDAAGFEAHVTGKTVTYARLGSLFGIEEYLPGRQVRWSVAPDMCQYGTWYQAGDDICFVYEADPEPHCWTFWLQDGALVAHAAEDAGFELLESASSTDGLPCPGPDVGV